jgi:hypothetical protein
MNLRRFVLSRLAEPGDLSLDDLVAAYRDVLAMASPETLELMRSSLPADVSALPERELRAVLLATAGAVASARNTDHDVLSRLAELWPTGQEANGRRRAHW